MKDLSKEKGKAGDNFNRAEDEEEEEEERGESPLNLNDGD